MMRKRWPVIRMRDRSRSYRCLKLAQRLFAKPMESLNNRERAHVEAQADKQQEIERVILRTPEAAAVVVPHALVDADLRVIRSRYASGDEYRADLQRIGIDEDALRAAIERERRVQAVLDQHAADTAGEMVAVSDTDVEIFYLMHRQHFRSAETRVLRHILITINDSLIGNQRDEVQRRLRAIRRTLIKSPQRFAEEALKHSECPTAMNSGHLGTVPRGQLYPELEAVAFALRPGGLSEIVESPLGLHVLRCDSINAGREASLAEASAAIRRHLEQMRRRLAQKSWIEQLEHDALTQAA